MALGIKNGLHLPILAHTELCQGVGGRQGSLFLGDKTLLSRPQERKHFLASKLKHIEVFLDFLGRSVH